MTAIPITRLAAVAMSGVLCFVLIVPLALQRHNVPLAVALTALFALYLVANVVLWQRMNRRPR
jgi:uncharacterized protein (DUF58 family)